MSKKGKYINWLRRKQGKPTNGRPSTETNNGNSVSSLQVSPPGTQLSATYHRSIRTLIYDDFLSVLTGEELSPLIISGTPPVDELVTAWEKITDEYSNAIKTPKSTSIFDCYKKIIKTKSRIQLVDAALFYLEEMYDEEIAQVLFDMGFLLITAKDDRKEYLHQLTRVKTEAKTLIVLLNQYHNEYKILSPDGEQVTRTYESYIEELAILSKYQGGGVIHAKNITVLEYISIVNGYMAYNEILKHQQEKKHG